MASEKKNALSEMIEILEQATVIYTDGVKEIFDTIRLTDKGVVIGHISSCNDDCDEFIDCGFISRNNIKNISYVTQRIIRRTKVKIDTGK